MKKCPVLTQVPCKVGGYMVTVDSAPWVSLNTQWVPRLLQSWRAGERRLQHDETPSTVLSLSLSCIRMCLHQNI